MSIASELQAILDASPDNILRAEDVVEWARKHPNSDLYKAPEFMGWDMTKLAHEHLLWGARKLIVMYVTDTTGNPSVVSLRFDRPKPKGGYRSLDDVLSDKSLYGGRTLYDHMLADALKELEHIQQKYARITALKPVWTAVTKVRRKMTRRKGRGGTAERRVGT